MDRIYVIIAGGVTLLVLLVLQVLVGKRIIHFKGTLHARIHRYLAYALLAFAAVHGTVAAGTLLGWF